ncbi:MAG TPA: glucan biosynthesis protein [Chthoniobacterales bacterium]|nr:glucan biosynthesis protein [Chthoniobacterales bacterium]
MKTHLVFAIMTIALLAFVISQRSHQNVTFNTVVERFTRQPLEPPKPANEALKNLTYDQARDIRYQEDRTLWRKEGLPFQVRFFFGSGNLANAPVTIFQFNRDGARQEQYSPDLFNFGPLVKLSDADKAAGNFSGFRVYYPIDKPDRLDEVVAFQGASYFRPRAKGQIYGLSARGIAVDTLGKEDFPTFTTFWLAEPTANASELKFYALLEGRDLSGAYEFRVQPGAETKIHVHARLFPRTEIKDIGFAPLTSMFWFGENTSNTFGDWRPEVHDSDGLQIQRSNGEWLWRPLAWAKQRQVNTFADTNPKGFGLFQRDRDFTHYQDLEANYHLRPSIWVQPDGDWGPGEVVLMQNPTKDEYSDNIVAYWRPQGGIRPGQAIDFSYTLTTFTENGGLPPLARSISTRIDYQERPDYRSFVLDFEGSGLEGFPPDPKMVDLWTSDNGILSNVTVQAIPTTKMWRVSFGITAKPGNDSVEMRCTLRNAGKPLSETWTYTWVK